MKLKIFITTAAIIIISSQIAFADVIWVHDGTIYLGKLLKFDADSIDIESFGQKKVALTVTSSKGCVVTKILDFFVEPCCADTSTLGVTTNIRDQICPNTATGIIQGLGFSGSPDYQYSLDCVNYPCHGIRSDNASARIPDFHCLAPASTRFSKPRAPRIDAETSADPP